MNGPGGLVVKVLIQHVRDMGLSPTWFQIFSVKTDIKMKDAFLL